MDNAEVEYESSSPSLGKLTAEFVAANLSACLKLLKPHLLKMKTKAEDFVEAYQSDFIQRVWEKQAYSKSFFVRNAPQYLYSFYIPLGVESEDKKIKKPSVSKFRKESSRVILSGSAGCGKSTMMRHLSLSALFEKQYLPVFVELRDLNDVDVPLIEHLHSVVLSMAPKISWELFTTLLEAGKFVLLLDGFDELKRSDRARRIGELKALTEAYKKCPVIVSSRPEEDLVAINDFSVFEVQPLTLSEAIELVGKLPCDADLKEKFVSDLRQNLYKSHKSFLSNPLLLSIMLLTYGETAEIPQKISIFYLQAYEVLFNRHDALKGGFQRDRLTDLDVADFAKVFEVFCLQTYDQRLFSFTREQALSSLKRAKKISGIGFNEENYFADLCKAVCLLVEDGLVFSFAHRSFQEYFVARFIDGASHDIQSQLLLKYQRGIMDDSVMDLLFELNPRLIETEIIIPKLNELRNLLKVKQKVGITHFVRFLKIFDANLSYAQRRRSVNIIWNDRPSWWLYLFFFVLRNMGDTHFDIESLREMRANRMKDFFKGKKVKSYRVNAKEISLNDPLVREIAFHTGSVLSIEFLQFCMDLPAKLESQRNESEKSLVSILGLGNEQ